MSSAHRSLVAPAVFRACHFVALAASRHNVVAELIAQVAEPQARRARRWCTVDNRNEPQGHGCLRAGHLVGDGGDGLQARLAVGSNP